MADSTNDFVKKILVDVELKAEQLRKDLPPIIAEIERLSEAQAKAKKAGDTTSRSYIQNAQDLRELKTQLKETNKYIDNTSKAIAAETGSIQQNRAVLSLVTADYVKLGQVEGQTDAATVKLAVDVNNLTSRLKEQEKGIGQTYRNVGNYTDSINASNVATGKASQGMQTFASGLETARKGIGFLPQQLKNATAQFGPLKDVGVVAFTALNASLDGFSIVLKDHKRLAEEARNADLVLAEAENVLAVATAESAAAQEAEAAGMITKAEATAAATVAEEAQVTVTEAQTVATIASTAATGAGTVAMNIFKVALASTGVGLLVIALGALVAYFSSTNEGAKKFKVILAEVNAVAQVALKLFGGLGKIIYDTLSGNFKDLPADIAKTKEAFNNLLPDLAKNVGAARDLTIERQKLTKAEREWSEEKTKQQGTLNLLKLKIRDLSTTEEARIKAAKDAKVISDNIYAGDLKNAQKNIEILEKEGKVQSKVDYQAITDGKNRMQELKNAHDSEIQSIQNRESRVEQMGVKRAAREKKAADKLASDQAKALLDAEQIKKDSIARELQDIYEGYGDKTIAINNQYDKELTKLNKFLAEKHITQKEFNSVEAQLTTERNTAIAKLIEDFNRNDLDRYRQALNSLTNLQIEGIQNDTERTIAALKQKGVQELEELEKQNQAHLTKVEDLTQLIETLSGEERAGAEKHRDAEFALVKINDEKTIELKKQTANEIAKVNKQALDAQNKLRDANDVTAATKQFGGDSKQAIDAKKRQLLDNYNAEVSQAGLTADAKLEIERKYLMDVQSLEDSARARKIGIAVEAEQLIQSTAFDIISQGAQASQQKAQSDLQNRKAAELDNQALTATEKKLIEQKYQKQDLELKRQAFKDNQRLQAANILINGAVAVTAALMLPPPADIVKIAFIGATTAASIAKTLAAKPGFATGGVYKSDGRGAMLSGYSRHDNINSSLRSGEAVVVSEAMRVPWARNTVSKINEMFGGRSFRASGGQTAFAAGGLFTDGGNANRYYSKPVTDSDGMANTLAYQLINNFPSVIVDVKDIIAQTAIKASVENRVIL